MGKLVTNPAKPVVRVKVSQTNYRGIANLAQTVHDDTLANVADFATPLPTSANLQTAITNLRTGLYSLGTKFNRGGSAALANVKALSFIVFAMLTERAAYVQQIVDASGVPADQAVLIAKSGFAAKSKRSSIPKAQFTRRVRQSSSKQYPYTLRRVKWRKSLGLLRGTQIRAYNIYARNTDGTKVVFLTSTTKTNFFAPLSADYPVGGTAEVKAIIIRPVTATGEGNAFTIPLI